MLEGLDGFLPLCQEGRLAVGADAGGDWEVDLEARIWDQNQGLDTCRCSVNTTNRCVPGRRGQAFRCARPPSSGARLVVVERTKTDGRSGSEHTERGRTEHTHQTTPQKHEEEHLTGAFGRVCRKRQRAVQKAVVVPANRVLLVPGHVHGQRKHLNALVVHGDGDAPETGDEIKIKDELKLNKKHTNKQQRKEKNIRY